MFRNVGVDWIGEQVGELTDHVEFLKPSEFNEQNRYLPASVTPMPGFLRYDVNPFMREIVDCFAVESPVREVNVKKGVQITYTTAIESVAFYFMAHIKTAPLMYITADKELASLRIENNFIPMIQQSGFADIIRSADIGNSRKTGSNKNMLQWEGGGYLVPLGALNAAKLRQTSALGLLEDEIDGWPDKVGKDGDPIKLCDGRARAYWDRRKIFRGSTPTVFGLSKIDKQYERGDQRKYNVLCKECGFAQFLRWSGTNEDNGIVYGMDWELEDGILLKESVCYRCMNCGHPHYEYDKIDLFSEACGAHWKPTAKPIDSTIRSYHLPALYSPAGMQPWYQCVIDYLDGWDVDAKAPKDMGAFQVFYNNILGESFKIQGDNVTFNRVSGHRRVCYRLGEVPNEYAKVNSGGEILFLTCQVDVHKKNLAVSVKGWTRTACCYLIDYWRFEGDCLDPEDVDTWGRLRDLISEGRYTADDGKQYIITKTFIDSGYQPKIVCDFCQTFPDSVYPIRGVARTQKAARVKEFFEFKTMIGTTGYNISVDHYKDNYAPVLRRQWIEDMGEQKANHFNTPVDITDKQLKELTKEVRRMAKDNKGAEYYEWHRLGNAANELWDLLMYGRAGFDIICHQVCVKHLEMESADLNVFLKYLEENHLYFEPD